MSILCQIFKSSRKQEMYLYVEKNRGVADVPLDLMERFGEPLEVMSLVLSSDKKLARAKASDVLQAIANQGYYLQMPPTPAQILRRDGSGA
ncbi:MAG: YcgL domain-containing protein [Halieaceae bacterium]|nr:YcgL domain-containing protein [Halieaceae bacterium]